MAINLKSLIYVPTLFFITLSGFAQMPIFKRYYIADIPGLGWLAEFYITHIIHYSFAIVLIAFSTYAAFDYFFRRPVSKRLSRTAHIKIFLIGGLILSGVLMVIRNLPDIYLPHRVIIALDLIHLGFCMMFLVAALFAWIKKKGWYN